MSSKVSALTTASALDGTEKFHGVQGGADRAVTTAQVVVLARAAAAFSALTKTAVKSANYTTTGNEIIPTDTSSASFNLQLPTTPPDGTLVWLANENAGAGTGWSLNPLFVLRGGTDKIDGVAANASLVSGRGVLFQYNTANTNWRILLSDSGVATIGALLAANNLSDVASAATARTNLGVASDSVEFLIDGGGSAIATGIKGDIEVPFACTINSWTLLADQSGSIVVDIWKNTYANFPPTSTDVITASAKPTISSATKGQSSTLTGWTTACAKGDILRFNVNSAATVTRVTLSLKVTV